MKKQMEINFRMNLAESYSFKEENIWAKNHVAAALLLRVWHFHLLTVTLILHVCLFYTNICLYEEYNCILMAVKVNNAAYNPFVSVAAAVVVVVDYF